MGLVSWVRGHAPSGAPDVPVPVSPAVSDGFRDGLPGTEAPVCETCPEDVRTAAAAEPAAGGAGTASGDPVHIRPRAASDRDGAVSVRDGRVRVRKPRGGGRWPSVEAGEPIADHPAQVRINGRPLAGSRVVRDTDRVELYDAEQIVPGGIDVEIDPDGLRAWATVHPPICHQARLTDARPGLQLRLEMRLCDVALPPEVTEEDVVAAVERTGVRAPLREGAVARALAGPGERVLVAEGLAAGRGLPTKVWNCFDRQFHVWRATPDPRTGAAPGAGLGPADGAAGSPGASGDDDPPVEMGETLVVVRTGRPGRSGYTVGGEVLTDTGSLPPRLVAGPGVMLSDDGLTAIAAQPGRVSITTDQGWIGVTVHEQRRVDGDVESHSRLHVRGNLHVAGSVQPNCEIFAAGRVEVEGDVVRARIESGGSVEIRGGVGNGLLLAGGAALIYREVIADFEGFVEAAVRLERGSDDPESVWRTEAGEDGWTPRLRRVGFRIVSAMAKADLECDPVVVEFGRSLSAAMARRRAARLDVAGGELEELLRQAEAALGCMRAALALPANCRAGHLDHARLEATGDVDVTGAGCYRTNIKAGGSVRVAGRFRDGSVACAGDATFEEIGSPGEVSTKVYLPADGCFRARLVHPGTVVRIGSHARMFELPVRDAVLGRDAPATVAFARTVEPRSGRVQAARAAV